MRTPEVDKIRLAIKALCPDAKAAISTLNLAEYLGITDQEGKARLRRRMTEFTKRGELIRVEPGVFTYNPKAAPRRHGEIYQRIWRAVRAKRPGWCLHDIEQVTRANYTHVLRYCQWLAAEGYIERCGKQGTTNLWRTTALAKNRTETPYPPRFSDPFEAERNAACRLVRCLMEADPNQPRIKEKIVKDCQTLLTRFRQAEGETHYGD